MKTALILGATGLIGKKITEQLLDHPNYSSVIILVRKKLSIHHPKLTQQIFNYDFPNLSLIKADDVYCSLGTTIKTAGSKEAFRKVDYDYVVTIAKAGKENGVNQIAVISAMGANKDSNIFYNRTKGEMEAAIKKIGFNTALIIRPSMLLGNRTEFRFGELIGKYIMTSLSFLIPKKYKAIYDVQVAKATIYFMNSNLKGFIVKENEELIEHSTSLFN
jgi:uncharacterized protein YbjT (DUF2867 family)